MSFKLIFSVTVAIEAEERGKVIPHTHVYN